MKKREQDDAGAMLKRIMSPADAQSLVMPPPDHPPQSGPAVSTPLTGNLKAPPSQATPSRQGLAGYLAAQAAAGHDPVQNTGASQPTGPDMDQGPNPMYVKVASGGQVGYLPRANLARAQQIDRNLKILED